MTTPYHPYLIAIYLNNKGLMIFHSSYTKKNAMILLFFAAA